MKLTNKQIRQIIKEELDDVLKQQGASETYEKIKTLMTNDQESFQGAAVLFDSIKGTGTLQEWEEEYLQKLSSFGAVFYEYKSVSDEIQKLLNSNSGGTDARANYKELKKQSEMLRMQALDLESTIDITDREAFFLERSGSVAAQNL